MSLSIKVTVRRLQLVMLKYLLDNDNVRCELISNEKQMREKDTFTLLVYVPTHISVDDFCSSLPKYVTIERNDDAQ